MIGQSLPRLEDAALLRGTARFIDDLDLEGQAHAWFVRSPHGHARIVAIDDAPAREAPGVVAVLTARSLPADAPRAMAERAAQRNRDGAEAVLPARALLAAERVRHVGDTVAMVIAETRAQARDAAELVEVEYQELASVSDARAALAAGAPQLFDQLPGNLALDWEGGDPRAVERAFGQAAHVVRLTLVNNRIVIAPLETRGVLAAYESGTGRYTLHTPSQGVNEVREGIAAALGAATADLRVLTPQVGGGFGIKIVAYPEHPLVAWAARWLGRPVKWVGDRSDAFVTDYHGRDHVTDAALALDAHGRILAIRHDTVSNAGAYASGPALTIPTTGGSRCATGVYAIPAWCARTRVAVTNTVPVSAYRGAGKPEYNYVVERLVDAAARALRIDPAEIRRRNVVPPEAMPYETGTGIVFDSGEFARNMEDAITLADRAGFEARRDQARSRGRLRGLGLAMFQEPDGFLDNRVTVVFDAAGRVTVTLTGQENGQGHTTTFAQVAAAELGVPLASVRVRQGDTDSVGPGRGTGGSRVATVAGSGIVRASRRIVDKAKALAAHLLEASEADLEFDAGTVRVVGTDRALGIGEIAAAAFDGARLPAEMEPALEATSHYLAREYNYPCGAHLCEVEIDPETGALELVRYAAVNDHGVAINPMLLEGQVHGGIVQGIGQALHERCVYEDATGQLLTGTFMDYGLPRAGDLPHIAFERNVVPARTNPLGVKGVGESGCTAAPAAVMHAVIDALSPLGITHIDMPVTPEGLWRAIGEARARAG
jgi:carbon-monoxide dehydrogenase large subunit